MLINSGASYIDNNVIMVAFECVRLSGQVFIKKRRRCDPCREGYAQKVVDDWYQRNSEFLGKN